MLVRLIDSRDNGRISSFDHVVVVYLITLLFSLSPYRRETISRHHLATPIVTACFPRNVTSLTSHAFVLDDFTASPISTTRVRGLSGSDPIFL